MAQTERVFIKPHRFGLRYRNLLAQIGPNQFVFCREELEIKYSVITRLGGFTANLAGTGLGIFMANAMSPFMGNRFAAIIPIIAGATWDGTSYIFGKKAKPIEKPKVPGIEFKRLA